MAGKKIINMPKPKDADGNELTPQEVEELASEPMYVPVELKVGESKLVTFHVATDFDQVDREAKQSYEIAKAKNLALLASGGKPKNKVSNIAHLKGKQGPDTDDDDFNPEQYVRMIEQNPAIRESHINLMFPKGHEQNPVIIPGGYSVPNMPTEYSELLPWFKRGGLTADTVLDELVIAYDPTGPLAAMRQATQKAASAAASTVETDSATSGTTTEPESDTTETET